VRIEVVAVRLRQRSRDAVAGSEAMSDPSKVFALMGLAANDRGRDAEHRVLAALLEWPPAWVLSARLATRDEDRRGIDIVVVSDVGELFLQVKASKGGEAHARIREDVRIVVARPTDTAEQLRRRAIGHLSGLREGLAREWVREPAELGEAGA
jgi:hypothetical protein